MLRAYEDIISRLGKPLWYDGNGVPRYEPFHPDLCGVYDYYVAYLEIGCQGCNETWMVAVEADWQVANSKHFQLPTPPPEGDEKKIEEVEGVLDDEDKSSPWLQVGSFHFGDPPRHGRWNSDGCSAGDTMNSVPLRIHEFWEKDTKGFEWVRKPKYEFGIKQLTEEQKEKDPNEP